MNKYLLLLLGAGFSAGAGYLGYWAFNKANTATNLRVGIGEIKGSWDGGIKLEIGLDIENPTDGSLKLDKIDLVGSYKGKDLGNTIPGKIDTVIQPNAKTRVTVNYVIPISALLGGVLSLGFDLVMKIQQLAKGGKYQDFFKGIVLSFKGSATSGSITVPFNFDYDLGA